MKYILIFLPIFLVSAKVQDNNISIDKINGIYVSYDTYDNRSNNVIAICRDQKTKEVKIAFSFLIDSKISNISIENKKISPEKWQPYKDDMVSSKTGIYETFTYFFKNRLTSYIMIEKNNKIYGATIIENKYDSSYAGKKIKDNFEIIDMKTKKVLEICKSQ